MADEPKKPLRLVVLTRRGRCASARAAIISLIEDGHPVDAVVAEPWLNLVFSKGVARGLFAQLIRHGWKALWQKLRDQFGRSSAHEPLEAFCRARGIAYHQVADHNSDDCVSLLEGLSPDLLVTANTRILLPRILRVPRQGGLNIHKSLLPRYAGLESIFWALYHGESQVGVTIHRLVEGLDTGDIMGQTSIPVEPGDGLESLDRKADQEAARLLAAVVGAIQSDKSQSRPQDSSQRTYFSWPTPRQRSELELRLRSRRVPAARRRLIIINADDFGLTPSVNKAVIECHKKGVVTSATLLANGPAFDEAAALAKSHPGLGVGLHFNLTLGRPLCLPSEIPSLVDQQGSFFPRHKLELRALFGRIDRRHVCLELKAQFLKLTQAGLKPTHLDGHQHCHVLPGVFQAVAEFCRDLRVAVRCPRPAPLIRRTAGQGRAPKTQRSLRSRFLSLLLAWQWTRHGRGLASNDFFTSIFDILPLPSKIVPSDYAELLAASRMQGVVEIMVHPACHAQELKGLTRIGDVSEGEYRALLGADFKRIAGLAGSCLGHYGQSHFVVSVRPYAPGHPHGVMTSGPHKDILLLCPHPVGVAPGQRLKYEQYFDFLRDQGYHITVSPFMTHAFWDIVYQPGRFFSKVFWTLVGYCRRIWDLFRMSFYDGVYVFLWGTPFGPAIFERLCRLLSRRLVYDIDDLVYLGQASKANPLIAFLKGRGKPQCLAANADHVITCTPYLDSFVRQWNPRTTDISSTVDLDIYRPKQGYDNDHRLVLGWSGSHSTAPYLHLLDDVLRALARKLDFRLLVIGERSFAIKGLDVEALPWRLETEVEDLLRIDIGLYPLPDETWVQGKSGLKAIQYMALGIPTIATAIGTNFRVIEDGVSGYLVKDPAGWEKRILELAADPGLRRRVGCAGRARVSELFSVQANRPRYLEVFEKVFR